jgi:NAD(P)H dehydrogenase (quinone)
VPTLQQLQLQLAAELSKQTGKNIPYKNLPETEYAAILKSFGVPDGFAYAIAGWDISVSKGDMLDNTRQLSKLTGKPTTSLSRSIKNALSAAK